MTPTVLKHSIDVGDTFAYQCFWMGGHEGADRANGHGVALDLNRRNGHSPRMLEDYRALVHLGIRAVRESIGWRTTAAAGQTGYGRFEEQVVLAAHRGVQVVWPLTHYGWPTSSGLFTRPYEFIDAVSVHCARISTVGAFVGGDALVWQPINEISFLSCAASSTGLIHPHVPSTPQNGHRLNCVLVRAARHEVDAIRAFQPDARFIHPDPLLNIAPPLDAGLEACEAARRTNDSQYDAREMLAGLQHPELGGAAYHLDILGIIHYHDNQWDHGSDTRFHWHLAGARRGSFSALAGALWLRHGKPMCLFRTGHVGEGSDAWLDDMAAELLVCRQNGVPLDGICLYPVIDRPDWQTADHWHHSGLRDVPGADRGDITRHLCLPYARRLRHWQDVPAELSRVASLN